MSVAVPAKCARPYCNLPADPRLSDGRCVFHSEQAGKPTADFAQAIAQVEQQSTALWRGWVVPVAVAFAGRGLGTVDLTEATFLEEVSFASCSFGALLLDGATFKKAADFSGAGQVWSVRPKGTTWEGSVSFVGRAFKQGVFANCTFLGPSAWDSVTADRLTIVDCRFAGETTFRDFSADSALTFVRTTFTGRTVFDRTDLTLVSFSFCRPYGLALSGAVKLANAEFHASPWPKTGILEEVEARTNRDLDQCRNAERVYRELRRGADDRRQYVEANASYRGELEMRRLAYRLRERDWRGEARFRLASLEALYYLTSDYGSSLKRPAAWLLAVLFLAPFVLSWSGLSIGGSTYELEPITDLSRAASGYVAVLGIVIRLAALLPEPTNVTFTGSSELVGVVLRVLGPLFALLFSLAVRRQVRR